MRSFRKSRRWLALGAGLLGGSLVAWSELPDRMSFATAGEMLERVFFREVPAPGGPVDALRPPSETRAALTQQLTAAPDQAQLYALRAMEAERALDITSAEQDWKAYAERAADPAEAQLALADFYQRRNRAAEEVEALLEVGRAPSPESERFVPASQQRSWKAFERALESIDAHLLGDNRRADVYRAWLGRYAGEQEAYRRYLDFLIGVERLPAAEDLLADFEAQFPENQTFALAGRARIAVARDGNAVGLAVYEQGFDPIWPEGLLSEYFGLLDRAERLRARLDEARTTLSANAGDLRAAGWVFHYRRRAGDPSAALKTLNDLAEAKSSWTGAELETLAALYRLAEDFTDAARSYYALYSLPGATPAAKEAGLAGLIDALLSAADQPLAFGSRNLSIYADIARADAGPGALNGVLSLLLNTQGVDWRFDSLDRLSQPYFRRAAAVELLTRLDAEFPDSARRPSLHAKAIEALALYGDDEAILNEGRRFLSAFPTADERTEVSLRMAEAYARQERVQEEIDVYRRLLTELGERADGVPLGPGTVQQLVYRPQNQQRGPRSPAYARTLDLAVSRLVAVNRPAAVELFGREIRNNPDDPGLYERFAGFLAANGLGEQVEAVYKQAMEQFEDRTWDHKLGRFYLRARKRAELEQLTRQSVDAFEGLAVEEYFRTVNPGSLDAQLYLQLNLYAHQRFPHNLTFVRNLLNAYRNRQTRNPEAEAELLRQHWFHESDLRAQYFGYLTRAGRLEETLSAIETGSDEARNERWAALTRDNPVTALTLAEGRAWHCDYEQAGPIFLALATETPVDEPIVSRAIDLSRSLAAENPLFTDISTALSESLSNSRPGDRNQLAFTGDIFADRKLYERAEPHWERMAATEPGRPQSYLEAATVFWDYYLYEDAVRLLEQGRDRLGEPTLFSYEAGAIAEGRQNRDGAVREYLQGALAGAYSSGSRLATLSKRDAYRNTIEQATSRLTAGAAPSEAAIRLRLAVLDAQQRRDDIAALLMRLAGDATSYSLLDLIHQESINRNLNAVQAAALSRRIELTQDPVDKLRRRLELTRLYESQGESAAAERVSASVYAENPRLLGVVRARTDFLWRSNKREQAIDTLVEAADNAYPELSKKFRFEAAQKAITAERYDRSRELLTALLESEPFHGSYLSAMADSYARQGRDADLRAFYEAKIEEASSSSMSAARKRDSIALLRRGLIPALERLGDHAGAIDQYIELVNRFPEDATLVEEAGLYALRHEQTERLEAAYVRTTESSPRDVRYHRVLAQLRMLFEDLPGALVAYENALKVRPDSLELHQSRAELLERQLDFDSAREAYEKLYELSYQEPRWIEKVGEIHARLGDADAAEAAVRQARIEGRPARPENYFGAARVLEGWGLDEAAFGLAEEGVELAGPRLYQQFSSGAGSYARLATRLRRHDIAWVKLRADLNSDYLWAFQEPVRQILQTADRVFTPEEKATLATVLDRWRNQASAEELDQALLPALSQSQIAEVEVRWRRDRLLAQPAGPQASEDRRRLTALEQQRMRHAELGRTLELHWQAHPARNQERHILDEAASAFRAAGDTEAELRILQLQQGEGRWTERYFQLLLKRDASRLIALAAAPDAGLAQNAANYSVLYGNAEQAREAVEIFGRRRPAVWTPAYTGLVGLFHTAPEDAYSRAFTQALGDATIGERIGQTVDRDRQLAGDRWFEYGARYGEYLSVLGRDGADDYLYAEVEAAPGRAAAYAAMAELYLAAGDSAAAEREYLHALELAPREASTHLRLARIAWDGGRRDDALGSWRTALARYSEQIEQFRLGPAFWNEVPALLGTLAAEDVLDDLRSPLDGLLDAYARKGGVYRLGEFLRPMLAAAPGEWPRILGLAEKAPNPVEVYTTLAGLDWAPADVRRSAGESALRLAETELAQAGLNENWYRTQAVYSARLLLAKLDWAAGRAEAVWDRLRPSNQDVAGRFLAEEPGLLLAAGARSGRIDEALEAVFPSEYSNSYYGPNYGAQPVAEAVALLRAAGSPDVANGLLETHYERQIERRELGPATLLGLAELRLEQGRPGEANALIQRLLRTSSEPFAHHQAAAELLLENGAAAEAAALLDTRVRSAPWDYPARLKLAQAQLGAGDAEAGVAGLRSLAQSPAVDYEVRAKAASALTGQASDESLGSTELDWLATGSGNADQPYFYRARIAAAEAASGAQRATLLESALATRPRQDSFALRRAAFDAERQAGREARALSALEPLLDQAGIGYLADQLDPAFAQDAYSRRADPYMADRFLYGQDLTDSERAAVAAQAGALLETLGRLGSAETMLDLAQTIEENPQTATRLQAVRNLREQRAATAARRPVIQEGLEQPHAVHPREGASE